jgi:hypothetical protein
MKSKRQSRLITSLFYDLAIIISLNAEIRLMTLCLTPRINKSAFQFRKALLENDLSDDQRANDGLIAFYFNPDHQD